MAATGPDCPFLQRGPSDNLTVCEQACAADGTCNVINFNPTLPDCVFRACADPLHPQLSPNDGYSVYGTVKASYTLDPRTFTLVTAPGSYTETALELAMVRYSLITFVYGPGLPPNASAPGYTSIPGLRVMVTGASTLDQGTDESYTLVAPDPAGNGWVTLSAPTIYGAMRGLETFSQLVAYNLTSRTYSMLATSIQDWPRFPVRAVMVDTSRHFITLSAMKLIMDQMGYLKLNVLHLHLSDDQSWPLELQSYPLLAQRSAFSNFSHTYSKADIAELVSYAQGRGIRVIPEFDSPSHFSSLFNAYPQYAAQAVDPKSNTSYLCMVDISKPETWTFLTGVWTEIASMFPDSHVHIGGDELWACWSQSATMVAWMKGMNFTITDAYYYYERRIIDILRGAGKKVIAWQDIAGFPSGFTNNYTAYPDVSLDVWSGCYSGNWQEDVSSLTAQNMSVVVSGPFYITQQNGSPTTPHFTWQQMYRTDLFNFTGGTQPGAQALVLGGELCAWDDAAQTDSGDLWMSMTPYMIGVAEAWWSPQRATSGVSPDENRAHAHRCRMGARGIPSHPIFAYGTYCPFEYEPLLASWD